MRWNDWATLFVGVFTLGIVTFQAAFGLWASHKTRGRRLKIINFLERGQLLRASVPRLNSSSFNQWIEDCKTWEDETLRLLKENSKFAAASFVHENLMPVGEYAVDSRVRNDYVRLLILLENLKGIMERPEVYF